MEHVTNHTKFLQPDTANITQLKSPGRCLDKYTYTITPAPPCQIAYLTLFREKRKKQKELYIIN